MAEALHIDRDKLILSPPDRDVPDALLDDGRAAQGGEPVAYITGRRAFWNIELHVGPGVLVPRPDSEVLIASAIEHFDGTGGPQRILDLGTGPGTLLLAALDVWPDATGLGIDVSRAARCPMPRPMPGGSGFENRASSSGSATGPRGSRRSFDLILCNPPYVAEGAELARASREFEPDEALFAGEEGLDAYRALAPQLPAPAEPGRARRGRDRPRPGRRGHRVARARRAAAACRARPRRTRPRALLVNLGLNENRLASGVRHTTSMVRAGPAPPRKLTSASVPPPTQSAVHFALDAQTGTRGSERAALRRRPACLRPKGLATTA